MDGNAYKIVLLRYRLFVSAGVMGIATGLLFFQTTEVKSNIASAILGGVVAYWFSIDGEASKQQNIIKADEVTQENATIQNTNSKG